MRSFVFGFGLLVACGSGSAVDGGTCDGVANQTIKGTPVTADQPSAWNGSTITIVTQNGDITVVGDAQDGRVHITATPFVVARACDPDVAEALADVAAGIAVSGSGETGCSYASKTYGSIPRASTGCTDVTVHVPPGSSDQPVPLVVHALNGAITIRDIALADHDCFVNGKSQTCPLQVLQPPTALAEAGDITITGVTGSVVAQSNEGNVSVSVTPNPSQQAQTPFGEGMLRSYVILQSTNGAANLTLPSDFAADSLNLAAFEGTVSVVGFPDLSPDSLSRGTPGQGAALVDVTANKGNSTLTSM